MEFLRLLAARLELLSADSHWAHRAGGVRGSILKMLQQFDEGETVKPQKLSLLTKKAFNILKSAAQDFPDVDSLGKKRG